MVACPAFFVAKELLPQPSLSIVSQTVEFSGQDAYVRITFNQAMNTGLAPLSTAFKFYYNTNTVKSGWDNGVWESDRVLMFYNETYTPAPYFIERITDDNRILTVGGASLGVFAKSPLAVI